MFKSKKRGIVALFFLLIATISFAQNKSVALNLGEVNDEFLQAGGWDTTQVDWTLECWIKFDAFPPEEAHLMEFWEGQAGDGGQFYLKNVGVLSSNGNSYSTGLSGETVLDTAIWYHLAFVLDGTNNLNTIYLNGEEEISGDANANQIGSAQKVLDSLVINNFRGIYTGYHYGAEGRMDEVRVWYKALSYEEINAKKDSALTSAEGLEAVYNFEDLSNLGKDATGNGHDANAHNIDASNSSDDAPPLSGATSIEEKDGKLHPNGFSLSQNYPNPFNPSTMINFTIDKVSNIELSIYNVLGEKVVVLANGNKNAGTYSIKFDAANLTGGVYFYKLSAGNLTSIKKMILLK